MQNSGCLGGIIPQDAHLIKWMTNYSYTVSREDAISPQKYVFALVATITSIALSTINIISYLLRAIVELPLMVINLNRGDELQACGEDLLNASRSISFVVASIFLILPMLIAPSWALSHFAPDTLPKSRDAGIQTDAPPSSMDAGIQADETPFPEEDFFTPGDTLSPQEVSRPPSTTPLAGRTIQFVVDDTHTNQLRPQQVSSGLVETVWGENHDPTKLRKYGNWMDQLLQLIGQVDDIEENVTDGDQLLAQDYFTLSRYLKEGGLIDENPRECYQNFCTALNAVCEHLLKQEDANKTPYAQAVEKVIDQIVIARWSEVSMDGYLEGLVHHVLNNVQGTAVQSQLNNLTTNNFASTLIEINKQIAQAPKSVTKAIIPLNLQKLRGAVGGEGYTENQNTPNIRSNETYILNGEPQKITYMRHACPTKGEGFFTALAGNLKGWVGFDGDTGERVTLNYKQFLSALERRRQGAFIVTHQQYDKGEEHTRVDQVRKLEQEHKNVAVLVQPVGQGALAKKSGPYENATTFDELRDAIFENFFDSDEGDCLRCQLPEFIKSNQDYRRDTQNLIASIRDIFFENADFSQAGVWHQFLLIFYTYQRHDLLFRFQEKKQEEQDDFHISYMTTFCKDFLDRGGISALVHASLGAMHTGRFTDDNWMQEQIRHVCGPPLMVKRIGVIESKLGIYEQLHKRFLEVYNAPDKREKLKELLPCTWEKHEVHDAEGQKAKLDISEMRNLAEFKDRLHWHLKNQGQGEIKLISMVGYKGEAESIMNEDVWTVSTDAQTLAFKAFAQRQELSPWVVNFSEYAEAVFKQYIPLHGENVTKLSDSIQNLINCRRVDDGYRVTISQDRHLCFQGYKTACIEISLTCTLNEEMSEMQENITWSWKLKTVD